MRRSYKNITVSQFQKISAINPDEPDEVKQCLKLEILSGKPYEYFDLAPFKVLEVWLYRLKVLESTSIPKRVNKTIIVNGHLYRLRSECKDFSKGLYLSIKAYDGKYIENLHKVLAAIYKPVFWRDKTKQQCDFKEATLGQVYGAFFLFSRKLLTAKMHIEYSMQESIKVINQRVKEMEIQSQVLTAGSTSSSG